MFIRVNITFNLNVHTSIYCLHFTHQRNFLFKYVRHCAKTFVKYNVNNPSSINNK